MVRIANNGNYLRFKKCGLPSLVIPISSNFKTQVLDFGCAKMVIHHDDTTITKFCSAPHAASVVFVSRETGKRRDRRVVVVNKTSSEAAL